jgi:hypothetical protein
MNTHAQNSTVSAQLSEPRHALLQNLLMMKYILKTWIKHASTRLLRNFLWYRAICDEITVNMSQLA